MRDLVTGFDPDNLSRGPEQAQLRLVGGGIVTISGRLLEVVFNDQERDPGEFLILPAQGRLSISDVITRLDSLQQLHALITLAYAGNLSRYSQMDRQDPGSLLEPRDVLEFQAAVAGSLWSQVRSYGEHGRTALAHLAYIFTQEGRNYLRAKFESGAVQEREKAKQADIATQRERVRLEHERLKFMRNVIKELPDTKAKDRARNELGRLYGFGDETKQSINDSMKALGFGDD